MSLLTVTFLAAPVTLAVLLVMMHSYLGLHVIEREVVFVDIGLSQVAALGSALSIMLMNEDSGMYPILFSLLLSLLVSGFLAYLRKVERKVAQEVLIGLIYAMASGVLILVADRLPHGAEHLKHALVGNILFVSWQQVLITGLVYSVIGGVHFIFRQQFWSATKSKASSPTWDFLFYLLFGIVITFSTHHAGVLVVFAVLVAPAALAQKVCNSLRPRFLFSIAFGLTGVIIAFALSVLYDLPSGPTIVASLTTLFFSSLLLLHLKEALKSNSQ